MEYFPKSLKVQLLLTVSNLPKELCIPRSWCGFGLHKSWGSVMSWPIENAAPCNYSVHSLWDVDVVLWKSTFLHFIQRVLLFPCLLKCVYVYVCISVSLSFISPSLWKSLGVYFSLCCFLLIFLWLLLPSQASEFLLLVPYILDSSFNSLSSLNLEKDTLFYTVLYQTSSVNRSTQKPLAFQIAPL